MMLAAMVALSVVGCGSKTLSNDYVTVKQYKGLESGYADWLVAPRYVNDFSGLVNGMRPQAMIFEKEYYETSGY